jgi:hypothetical protein
MAQKLGFFSQWMWGEWADRSVINQNADDLMNVEINVSSLQQTVMRQQQEILRLRAMIMGVVEVLHEKAPFDDAELEKAVQRSWAQLTMPPPRPQPQATDAYRNLPVEPAAPMRMETCSRCARTVPAAQTNITATGVVCDRCS